jgi:hypothetical protein
VEGAMMKSRFFPRKDEFVLSIVTALVVVGLVQRGIAAYIGDKKIEHSMFTKSSK